MAVFVETNSGNFERTPEGVHVAVCVGVWDMGTQPSKMYAPKRSVYLCWEVVGEKGEKGPFLIGEQYGMSLDPKSKLRPKLEAWRGRSFTEQEVRKFDLASLLGKPCQIQVTHNKNGEKTYANVTAIMAVPKGMTAPTPETPLSEYSLTQGKAYPEVMPDYIKKRIDGCLEFTKQTEGKALADEVESAWRGNSPTPATVATTAGSPLPWESGAEAY